MAVPAKPRAGRLGRDHDVSQRREGASGAEATTTNNRMELTAAAAALEALKRPCHVVIHTDSQYVRNGITRWSAGWVRKGWRNATGDPVANIDLWQRILGGGQGAPGRLALGARA